MHENGIIMTELKSRSFSGIKQSSEYPLVSSTAGQKPAIIPCFVESNFLFKMKKIKDFQMRCLRQTEIEQTLFAAGSYYYSLLRLWTEEHCIECAGPPPPAALANQSNFDTGLLCLENNRRMAAEGKATMTVCGFGSYVDESSIETPAKSDQRSIEYQLMFHFMQVKHVYIVTIRHCSK